MARTRTTINARIAPDQYSAQSTIEDVDISRINIDVYNQSIYWQLKFPPGNWEGTEVHMGPGSHSLSRGIVRGIRFRAATPVAQIPVGQTQAIVTLEALSGE